MNRELLRKFLQERCSEQETEEILKELSQGNENKSGLDHILTEDWNRVAEDSDTQAHERLWSAIERKLLQKKSKEKIGQGKVRKFDPWYFAKVAATITIIMATVVILVFQHFSAAMQKPEQKISQISKSTGWGEKMTFQLPDGSVVELNSGSSLSFPAAFSGDDRTVELHGEGFFKVVKDNEKPFNVISGNLMTTVLGTSFDVNMRENQIKVALLEGKVRVGKIGNVQKIYLTPGQSAVLRKDELRRQMFDSLATMAWKRDEIIFQKEPLADAFNKLENWYGVTIAVASDVDMQKSVSGVFPNQSLENIMKGLCFSFDCAFQINGKSVKVYNNKK